ncbi:hypothetical protein [Lysobacter silvisoli]|nr:hypothetical protein [Lysobacter silvisoli]
MFKKALIGMAGVLVVCLLAAAGYRYGQHLAQRDKAAEQAAAADATR